MTDVFQSTPPARGATCAKFNVGAGRFNFNPRPPRGGRPPALTIWGISTVFQSTPPARGATSAPLARPAGRDYFNPRPPRGGRLIAFCLSRTGAVFQSTPPARGATRRPQIFQNRQGISIHAPREGGDSPSLPSIYACPISIHAPREGGDVVQRAVRHVAIDFNPRPPRGGRPGSQSILLKAQRDFNPRPPRGGRLQAPVEIKSAKIISIHAPREGGDSKDAQFYLWIFDK